jgi:hypothetical protein
VTSVPLITLYLWRYKERNFRREVPAPLIAAGSEMALWEPGRTASLSREPASRVDPIRVN